MKKLIALLLALCFCLAAFTACGEEEIPLDKEEEKLPEEEVMAGEYFPIAMLVDGQILKDRSINQYCWGGVQAYGEEYGVYYQFYKPETSSNKAYMDCVKEAVYYGAEVIVFPSDRFEAFALEAAAAYEEVDFILVNTSTMPNDEGTTTLPANVYAISFAEEQAGFLAGYGVVFDGYTELGFLGGIENTATNNYLLGFVQGAEYAAEKKKVKNVNIRYAYMNTTEKSVEAAKYAEGWFEDDVNMVFTCGEMMNRTVIRAANNLRVREKVKVKNVEDYPAHIIGSDTNQASESPVVFTSAVLSFGNGIYDGIFAHFEDVFPGGQIKRLDASVNGVELPLGSSQFEDFEPDDYTKIYKQLREGKIQVHSVADTDSIDALALSNVRVYAD